MRALLVIIALLLASGTSRAQGEIRAGAFARMGFGARGLGMGNAMTGVVSGEVASYYNPALPAFADHRVAGASFGILSLDRSLNFLSFTQPIEPTGGLSVGLINAGVGEIDGRDGDGEHTETYSTYENQVYLSFSNRVDERVSIGVTIKLYHSKLFESVTTTTVGFDAGILVVPAERFSIGAVLQDIGSKYKWNTKEVYSGGRETEDSFPMLKRVGAAYRFPGPGAVAALDAEIGAGGTVILRTGIEYPVVDRFTIRAGADRIETGDAATGVKPAFGFTVGRPMDGWAPSISYAFSHESFAPRGFHLITLSAIF